jgi:glycosyltransferase involved in cell wall biosynthesis
MKFDFVNVAVVAYNSESTILDTLNSILFQSIGSMNIQLIVADDASKDATVSIVREWLSINGDKFHSIKLVLAERNCGVSANCNAAWKACEAEWVKTIAADDVLLPDCLKSFLDCVRDSYSDVAFFSRMEWFGDMSAITPYYSQLPFFNLNAKQQYNYLLFNSFNIAPTSFIKLSALRSIGYADEQYRLFEDLPLWLKFTSLGFRLKFNPDITVMYRISNSISKGGDRFVNMDFIKDCISLNLRAKTVNSFGLNFILKYEEIFRLKYMLWLGLVFGNKKWLRKLYMSTFFIISPVYFLLLVKKRLRG